MQRQKKKVKHYLKELPTSSDTIKYCHDCEHFLFYYEDEDLLYEDRVTDMLRRSSCTYQWVVNPKVRVMHTVLGSNDPRDYTHELPDCDVRRNGDCGLAGNHWSKKSD